MKMLTEEFGDDLDALRKVSIYIGVSNRRTKGLMRKLLYQFLSVDWNKG
jgi:hypothetical protein